MKRTGLAVFVLIIILPLMGQKRTTRTIEAEQFILRDAQGHERLTIGTPRISGATVGLQPDEPAIWLDREAKAHAVLTSNVSTTKGEAIQRYCPSCRRTTGWAIAFRERRDGHDRRGGSDRRMRST